MPTKRWEGGNTQIARSDTVNKEIHWAKSPSMQIAQLSQLHANALMKSLTGTYLDNWVEAFCEEQQLPRIGPGALSEDRRTYFLIESYLVGVF